MNRRTFLLALGATACSGPTSQRPKPPPHHEPPPDGREDPPRHGDVWGPPPWQGNPSPLAVFGERLVQRTESELRFWDLRTMQRTHTLTGEYRDACFLPDGRLAALRDSSGAYPQLHLIDASAAVDVRTGVIITLDEHTRVLATESADAIYIDELGKLVERCDLGGGHFRIAGQIELPRHDVLASLLDGRLVAATVSSLQILVVGAHPVELKTPGRTALIAPAAPPRAWIALIGDDTPGAQTLVLARLVDTLVVEARVDVSPGRIFDLAAADGAAAALIDTKGKTDYVRAVAVFEPGGTERWRAPAPMHGRAHLAMSRQRVVMMRNDGTLMAWDATSGAPI